MTTADRAFPAEQSDFELGDAYERGGYREVYALVRERKLKEFGIVDNSQLRREINVDYAILEENQLRCEVAEAFGVSPGDLLPYESAVLLEGR